MYSTNRSSCFHLNCSSIHNSNNSNNSNSSSHMGARSTSSRSLATNAGMEDAQVDERVGGSLESFLCASSTQRNFTVAVDVDEVLGRFLHSLNQYVESHHGQCYDLQDYFEYNFAKVSHKEGK